MKVNPTTNIPSKSSTDGVWIQWHKELKSNFGKKVANSLWSKAWTKRGSDSANTNTLRSYMEDNGVKVETSTVAALIDSGYDILDNIGDVFTMGKYVSIAVIIIILGGAAMLIFNIAKNPIGAANAAANLKSGGIR